MSFPGGASIDVIVYSESTVVSSRSCRRDRSKSPGIRFPEVIPTGAPVNGKPSGYRAYHHLT